MTARDMTSHDTARRDATGRKTAAVVMVQAFNTPAFPVDTHIHRLALRWGLTKNEKNASKCVYRCTYVAYFYFIFLCVGIFVAGGRGSRRLLRLVGSRDRIPRATLAVPHAPSLVSLAATMALPRLETNWHPEWWQACFFFFLCACVCLFSRPRRRVSVLVCTPSQFSAFRQFCSSATYQKCEQARIYSSTPPPFFSPCPPSATTPSACTTGWSQS